MDMEQRDTLGVVMGRFQGLHLGHMEYLLAGAQRCEHLLVGVTHFDPWEHAPEELRDLGRMNASANPFTYYERLAMLRDALTEAGLPRERFDIVPFPIEHSERIPEFIPREAVCYVTIYDQWGYHKRQVLTDLGFPTRVLWVRDDSQRLTSGTEVRRLIAEGKPWSHLVPPAVSRYLLEHGLTQRLAAGIPPEDSNPSR